MSYKTLKVYYETIFSMTHHHHYSISDLENLMVYELDIYVDLLQAHLDKVEQEQQETIHGMPV